MAPKKPDTVKPNLSSNAQKLRKTLTGGLSKVSKAIRDEIVAGPSERRHRAPDERKSRALDDALNERRNRALDEHSSGEVEMSFENDELREVVATSHNVLRSGAVQQGRSSKTTAVEKHLFESPPPSPGSIGPPPSTPRAQRREQYFQRKTYPEMVRADDDFHRMLDDLDGMRQWWTRNKQDWRQQKVELAEIDKTIAVLQEQILFRNSGNDYQLMLQRQKQDELKIWFEDNRSLMKLVWNRFRVVSGEARQQYDPGWARFVDTPQATYDEVTGVQGRRFEYHPSFPSTNVNQHLLGVGTAIWWLERAEEDLKAHLLRLKELIIKLVDDVASIPRLQLNLQQRLQQGNDLLSKGADDAVDDLIQNLLNTKPHNYRVRIRDAVDKRRRELLSDDNGQDEATLKAYKLKKLELDEVIIMLCEQDDIVETLVELLQHTIYALGASASLTEEMKDIFQDVHHNCFVYDQRRGISTQIRETLSYENLSAGKIRRIVSRIQQYHKDYKFNNTVLTPGMGSIWTADEIMIYHGILSQTKNPLQQLSDNIDRIKDEADPPEPRQDYRLRQLPRADRLLQRPKTSTSIAWGVLGWGSNMTLAEAKSILDEKNSNAGPAGKSNGIILREFFTSPDIFPDFSDKYQHDTRWTREQFHDIIFTKLNGGLTEDIIEAFLIYCTHANELFRTSWFRRTIRTLPSGWEICEENPRNGLLRNVTEFHLMPPEDIRIIEHIMLNTKQHYVGNRNRVTPKEEVRTRLNTFLPLSQQLNLDQFQQLAEYWAQLGKFFTWVPRDNDSLNRLDNGWKLDTKGRYLPYRFKHSYIDKIILEVISKDPRKILTMDKGKYYTTETALYDFYYGSYENGKEVMNWDITRYKFHLFLRWMTGTKDYNIFDLMRDGKVIVDRTRWITSYITKVAGI
ncbi:uncharacterized protein PAC_14712 [Phialocephala subalpina]|uniref:Uncharacterized protein n=1 Tax=Phialocephala subalpina TaxID=576137 RepID=A0A1L7XIF7_9HELO|nr:uncharacterized protein PAC_14712 [Phialocephala subalpina]